MRIVTSLRRQGVELSPLSESGAAAAGPDEGAVQAWMEAAAGSWRRRPLLEWTPQECAAWLEVGPCRR